MQAAVAPSRQNKKSLTVWVEPELVKDVKRLALDTDQTVQEIVASALRDIVKKRERKPA